MIQSQSLGAPPGDSGGNVRGDDGNHNRRSLSGLPIPRQEALDSRIHRHDSRDSGPSTASREWKRHSRVQDVSRRDDRAFKDRWKDRKRWEKSRIRELIRDPHRENARDMPRDNVLEHERSSSLKSYKGLSRDSAVEPSRGSDSQAAVEHNTPKLSHDDEKRDAQMCPISINSEQKTAQPKRLLVNDHFKGSKKFSRPPGDKFRDLLMGIMKTKQTAESPNQDSMPDFKDSSFKLEGESKIAQAKTTSSITGIPKTSDTAMIDGLYANDVKPEHIAEGYDYSEDDDAEVLRSTSNSQVTKAEPSQHTENSEIAQSHASNGHAHTESVSSARIRFESELSDKGDAEEDAERSNNVPIQAGPQLPQDDQVVPAEDYMDVEPFNSEKNESKDISKELKPVKAIPLLPQEREFQENLIEKFTAISGLVKPGKVQPKSWSLLPVCPSVVSTIYQREKETKIDLESRIAMSKSLKEAWARQATVLDELSQEDILENEIKKRVGSQAASKPQSPAVSNHSRKKSRDEDSVEIAANRRNRDRHSRAHGDVARSEAEFLEILASLEAQTARDPLVRARLTSARVPDQCQSLSLDRFCSTNALVKDHSFLLNRLKADALNNFTDDQHLKFIEAYVKWPKEFGKIGEAVGRSFNDCVMHYYQTKKATDYKKILNQRNKKKRGRKPRKRAEESSKDVAPTLLDTKMSDPIDEDDITSSSAGIPAALSLSGDISVENLDVRMPSTPSKETPTNDIDLQDDDAKKSRGVVSAGGNKGGSSARLPLKGTFTETTHALPERIAALAASNMPPSNVPPHVLPVQQMETLANVALIERPKWSRIDVPTFEELFKVFGLNLAEIAHHLQVSVDDIQRFLNLNYGNYEGLLRSVKPLRNIQHNALIAANTPFYASGSYKSWSSDWQAFEVAQNGQAPVASPSNSRLSTNAVAQIYDSQLPVSSKVPLPVLPLERSHIRRKKGAGQEKAIPVAPTATPLPIPSPPSDTLKPGAKFSTSEMQNWPELAQSAPVIPPILPRSRKSPVLQNLYGSEYLFTGFHESNERN